MKRSAVGSWIGLAALLSGLVTLGATTGPAMALQPTSTTTIADNGPNPSIETFQPFTATATVTGNDPTGTVDFWYTNLDTFVTTKVVGVALTGSSSSNTASNPNGSLPAGVYGLYAFYSGDANNSPSNSASNTPIVTQTVTGITLAPAIAGQSPSTFGTSVGFTATVTGNNPTGNVDFVYTPTGGGTTTQFDSVALSGTGDTRTATGSTTTIPVGTDWVINATYNNDANNAPANTDSNTPLVLQTVNPAPNPLTPTVATTVFDASTNAAWGANETTGASAYDTSTVTGSGGTPTGSVVYSLFPTSDCSGTASTTGTKTLSGGSVPNSTTTAALGAGSYSFNAAYSGDSVYSPLTSSCEPFTVGKALPALVTTVFDASTNSAWTGTEVSGATAYDTATVTGAPSIPAGGAVDYLRYSDGGCIGAGVPFGGGQPLVAGAEQNSNTTPTLLPGPYSFQAMYSGDANYSPTTTCESFGVNPGIATTVNDASTSAAWAGTETSGAKAYDTSTVTGNGGVNIPGGTMTYDFYKNGTCASPPLTTTTLALNANGTVPNSPTTAALGGGSYSFKAIYSGDGFYPTATGGCETFSVGLATATITTDVKDAANNADWAGTEVTGATAYDTAIVTGVPGIIPSGTVEYHLYATGNCTGSLLFNTQTITATGAVPNTAVTPAQGAGSHSLNATYSGDANYATVTSSCEPFSVNKATPTVSSVVNDASTNQPWAGTEVTGAGAYDTSTVTGVTGFVPSGTVTYTFYASNNCTNQVNLFGFPKTVTLNANGSVPNSPTAQPLGTFDYSFQAVYSGDNNYGPLSSGCETFSVGKGTPGFSTTVFDHSTNAAWAGTETTGALAMDTATVTGVSGLSVPPQGTVSYTFFSTASDCTGASVSVPVTLTSTGAVPNSPTVGPLSVGPYSFRANYSGDANYTTAIATCEPFTVGKGTPTITTDVKDGFTNGDWAGTESLGANSYDTASVTGAPGVVPGGTVTYSVFNNGTCTAPANFTGSANTITGGVTPQAFTYGPLGAGSYSFQAVYSGDTNYLGGNSACEPFTVGKVTPGVTTDVKDGANNLDWAGTEVAGAGAYDTSAITGTTAGFTPTGTVLYTIYPNLTCASSAVGFDTQTLSGGLVPKSVNMGPLAAGPYSFKAVYSGDTNYKTASAPCEPFTVLKASPSISTKASGSVPVGNGVNDVATLTGGFQPTGTVTFKLYGPVTGQPVCTTLVKTVTGIVGLSGGVVSATSAVVLPPAPGTYYWIASYGGDTNNNGIAGTCGDPNESVVVTQGLSPASAQLPDTSVCQSNYTQTFSVGNQTGYTFTATPPLPPGLTLSSSGTLSGKPTAAGYYSFRITASKTGQPSASKIYLLTVHLCIDNGNPVIPGATNGHAYSFQLNGTGGTAPYGFQLEGGALPDGLAMSDSGVVSGTPTTPGTYSFLVYVLDNANPSNSGLQTMKITVS